MLCLQEVDRNVRRSRFDDQPRLLAEWFLGRHLPPVGPHPGAAAVRDGGAVFQLTLPLTTGRTLPRRAAAGRVREPDRLQTADPRRPPRRPAAGAAEEPRGHRFACWTRAAGPVRLVNWHLGTRGARAGLAGAEVIIARTVPHRGRPLSRGRRRRRAADAAGRRHERLAERAPPRRPAGGRLPRRPRATRSGPARSPPGCRPRRSIRRSRRTSGRDVRGPPRRPGGGRERPSADRRGRAGINTSPERELRPTSAASRA